MSPFFWSSPLPKKVIIPTHHERVGDVYVQKSRRADGLEDHVDGVAGTVGIRWEIFEYRKIQTWQYNWSANSRKQRWKLCEQNNAQNFRDLISARRQFHLETGGKSLELPKNISSWALEWVRNRLRAQWKINYEKMFPCSDASIFKCHRHMIWSQKVIRRKKY